MYMWSKGSAIGAGVCLYLLCTPSLNEKPSLSERGLVPMRFAADCLNNFDLQLWKRNAHTQSVTGEEYRNWNLPPPKYIYSHLWIINRKSLAPPRESPFCGWDERIPTDFTESTALSRIIKYTKSFPILAKRERSWHEIYETTSNSKGERNFQIVVYSSRCFTF